MAKWIRAMPVLCGLGLLVGLPEVAFAQDPPPLPTCSMCVRTADSPTARAYPANGVRMAAPSRTGIAG